MTKYVDKSALVAEIERLKECNRKICGGNFDFLKKSYPEHYYSIEIYDDILSFLDTLETKEVDLENSMVCKVDWYDGFLLDYTQEQQDALLEKIGANVGDKVRVILIKE